MKVQTEGYIIHNVYSLKGSVEITVYYSMVLHKGMYKLQSISIDNPKKSEDIQDYEGASELLVNMGDIMQECVQDFARNNKDIPESKIHMLNEDFSSMISEDPSDMEEINDEEDSFDLVFPRAAKGYDFSSN